MPYAVSEVVRFHMATATQDSFGLLKCKIIDVLSRLQGSHHNLNDIATATQDSFGLLKCKIINVLSRTQGSHHNLNDWRVVMQAEAKAHLHC